MHEQLIDVKAGNGFTFGLTRTGILYGCGSVGKIGLKPAK